MYYDLHIHSALSPCSDDDMGANNIVNMAILNGLSYVAVTDHNSLKQLPVVKRVADQLGMGLIYGTELQSNEEVHILAYFKDDRRLAEVQAWLEGLLLPLKNRSEFFGHQFLLDESDEVIDEEEVLLLQSLNASIDEIVDRIHFFGGVAVLAHAMDRSNSIMTQLGFIPQSLPFDGIEIKNDEQKKLLLKLHPWIKDVIWLKNSDAHRLVDIKEGGDEFPLALFEKKWREYR